MSSKKAAFVVLGCLIAVAGMFVVWPFYPVAHLDVVYPSHNTLFPPDITAPTFVWQDSVQCEFWTVKIACQNDKYNIEVQTSEQKWIPDFHHWESIKEATLEKPATPLCLAVKDDLIAYRAWGPRRMSCWHQWSTSDSSSSGDTTTFTRPISSAS